MKEKSFLVLGNIAFRNKDFQLALNYYRKARDESHGLEALIHANLMRLSKYIELEAEDFIPKAILDQQNEDVFLESVSIRLEKVSLYNATGWAIAEGYENERIYIRADLNGIPIYIADTIKYRGDVMKLHGGDGFNGYSVELNEYFDFEGRALISVSPINGVANNKQTAQQRSQQMPRLFNGEHFTDINLRSKDLVLRYINDLRISKIEKEGLVSIIILNLNGFDVLCECVASIIRNTKCLFEIIIVDHGSNDGSLEYIKSIFDNRIKLISRGKNFSFSESNNFAAKNARGDVLLFMNNDMIVVSDVISEMANACRYSDFGLVGVKLWDMPKGLALEKSTNLNVVQHLGVHFKDTSRSNYIEAYESRLGVFFPDKSGIYKTPAVTAAMMAITKVDFDHIGGFCEKYFYGQEDVDFCIKYLRANLRETGVLIGDGVYHARGLSRRVLSATSTTYLKNNRDILQREQASWLRRYIRATKIEKAGYWNPKPYAIAMIVSEISFETEKADYFTARELGDALECNSHVVGYFSEKNKHIDVNGYDAVIVFIDSFDVTTLENITPDTIIIAWARNWFDRWCDRSWVGMYDIIFASSSLARDYMSSRLHRKVGILRIAASQSCVNEIKQEPKYTSDYCFTGSYFGSPREIADLLKPDYLPYKFGLYGHNWAEHDNFSKYTRGPVSYLDIPSVYAATKLVVDDANIATKKWGSLNCRIYDSLAAGTFCLTNNKIGVSEIFSDDYPTYDDANSLHDLIGGLLSDDVARNSILNKYRDIVLNNHTYMNRADQLLESLKSFNVKIKISIKISSPNLQKAKNWGDLYFARALAKHLEVDGFSVRIDCMDQWYAGRSLSDDVVISLRGLDRYKPRMDQHNILWIISHPERVSTDEINEFDKIYVASELYTEKLKQFTEKTNIEMLFQASDFSVDSLDLDRLNNTHSYDILFIGNSRGHYRDVVRWCVEAEYPISIYGQGWSGLIDEKFIINDFVDNDDIPYLYNRAKVVLNDHWVDMKKLGFVSNRVWDVLASGGVVLTDYIPGLDMVKLNRLLTYNDVNDFYDKIKFILNTKKQPETDNDFTVVSFRDQVSIISNYIRSNLD